MHLAKIGADDLGLLLPAGLEASSQPQHVTAVQLHMNALWGLSSATWSSQPSRPRHALPLPQDLELAVREVCPALEGCGVTTDDLRVAGLLPALPSGPGGKLTDSLCAMCSTIPAWL